MHTYQRMLLLLAPLVLLVACSDSAIAPTTAPLTPSGAVRQVKDLTTESQEITVIRTTDAGKSRRVKVTKIKQGRGTIAAGAKLVVPAPIIAEQMIANGPPLPRLTYASSSRNMLRGHWTQSAPYGIEPGAVMEWSGKNDEPASMMRLVRNGITVYTITRKFQRGATGWELVRQETEASNGVRDVIDIKRSGGELSALAAAPFASLSLMQSTSRTSDEAGSCGGDLADINVDDKCKPYKDAADEQYVRMSLALVAASAACLNPLVATPAGFIACGILTGNWAIEAKSFDRMYAQYLACVRFYEALKATKTSGPCDDPGGFPDYVPDAPESSGGGGSIVADYTTCSVYIEYDMLTGEIYYMQVLACW